MEWRCVQAPVRRPSLSAGNNFSTTDSGSEEELSRTYIQNKWTLSWSQEHMGQNRRPESVEMSRTLSWHQSVSSARTSHTFTNLYCESDRVHKQKGSPRGIKNLFPATKLWLADHYSEKTVSKYTRLNFINAFRPNGSNFLKCCNVCCYVDT